jgi:ABC-type polar amino acid transport system ATPase subunit
VVVDGIDMLDPRTDINHARQRIGMVFQSFNLYPHMTALGNVTLALRKVAGKARADAEALARAALERVGLADRAGHTPASSRAASSSGWRSRGRSRSSRA